MTGSGSWEGRTATELAAHWGVPLVEAYPSIGSTNDRAAELARVGTPRGTVIVAEEQTAGRGRRGARWQSAPGAGLWMSVILGPGEATPALPLLVGLACAEGIEAGLGWSPGSEPTPPLVRVKWPNDLFVHDRKVGGILCEAGPHGVVVGIGINVRAPAGGFDDALAESATALEVEAGKVLLRSDIAREVLRRVLSRVGDGRGWAGARPVFAERDALCGRAVVTESAGAGVAVGVDAVGALVLERSDGSRVPVTSGSVRLAGDVANRHHAAADGPGERGRPNRGG